jgi:phosphomannomutase
MTLRCFKTYDVRGKIGSELDEAVAFRIGRAFAQALNAKTIAIGHDVRLSSPALKAAIVKGTMAAGCDVIDLGQTGTEEVYFASFHLDVDAGVEITASHNPADYNGMKFIARSGAPLTQQQFDEMKAIAENNAFRELPRLGTLRQQSILAPYVDHLLSVIDVSAIPPLRIVSDAGNGMAGHVIDALESHLPVAFIKTNHEPDGNFPKGVPNPLLPDRRAHTAAAVKQAGADMGLAWDGDFDRCFFYDGSGEFVSGYYISALLTKAFLMREPSQRIIVDSRQNWATLDIIRAMGASGRIARTGHSFFKKAMRDEDAVYGGEVSAHHYFRDFASCDSGMLPWLMVLEYLGKTRQTLAAAVADLIAKFPSSDELNFTVADVPGAIENILDLYKHKAQRQYFTDGLSLEFDEWRFNLRGSNTEALLRLNVETKADPELLARKVAELSAAIADQAALATPPTAAST